MDIFNTNDIPEVIFDREETLEKIDNNEAIIEQLILTLSVSVQEAVNDISHAYETNDFEELHKKAHKLHGGLCYVEAPQLRYITSHYETFAKLEDQSNVELIHPMFLSACERLLAQI